MILGLVFDAKMEGLEKQTQAFRTIIVAAQKLRGIMKSTETDTKSDPPNEQTRT